MSGTGPVGFVGAGTMGAPMVHRLLAAGREVVLFARTPARVADLVAAGAVLAPTPAVVAEACGVVVGCLGGTAAVEQVYLGPDGLLGPASPGQVFVEHATFDPALAVLIAGRLAERGAGFVDAPVTGGPEGARDGTLVAMAGGPDGAAAAARELASGYLGAFEHVGGPGAGLRLKLVNQLLVSVHAAAAAEAAAAVTALGVDPVTALRVLGGGWADSRMLRRVLVPAARREVVDRGASLGGLAEAQGLLAGLLADLGVRPVLLPAARRVFDTASAAGDADLAALVRAYDGPG